MTQNGLTSSASVIVYPKEVFITIKTVPVNVVLTMDSQVRTKAHAMRCPGPGGGGRHAWGACGQTLLTPKTVDSLIKFKHTVVAPATVCKADVEYTFQAWSPGTTSKTLVIEVPNVDTTYTAVRGVPCCARRGAGGVVWGAILALVFILAAAVVLLARRIPPLARVWRASRAKASAASLRVAKSANATVPAPPITTAARTTRRCACCLQPGAPGQAHALVGGRATDSAARAGARIPPPPPPPAPPPLLRPYRAVVAATQTILAPLPRPRAPATVLPTRLAWVQHRRNLCCGLPTRVPLAGGGEQKCKQKVKCSDKRAEKDVACWKCKA